MNAPVQTEVALRAHNPVDLHVGSRLRMLRKRRQVSQEKLAEALGLTFQQVQKYERGVNRISASMMWKACLFLEAPITALFEGLGPQTEWTEPAEVLLARTEANTADGQELLSAFGKLDRYDRDRTVRFAEALCLTREPAGVA